MTKKKADYNYVRKYFTFDGRTYEVTGKTEEEALEKNFFKLQKLEAGQNDSNKTVKERVAVWYETYVAHRKGTAKTKATYKGYLDRVVVPSIGNVKLNKITAVRLQQLLNARAGNSLSDLSKLRMVLRGLFGQAYRNRLISFDPSEGLELPEVSKGGHRSLTEAERAALIAVWKNYCIFLTAFTKG